MSTSQPVMRLTNSAARRIALAAQGFALPRKASGPGAGVRDIRRAVDTMGLLQLDSVNVLIRSHYLPVFSRIGPYPREVLDRLSGHQPGAAVFTATATATANTAPKTTGRTGRSGREYVEYWAHEASLVPFATHPLLRWRMQRASEDAWGGMRRIAQDKPHLLDDVRRLVTESGPIRSSQLGIERAPKRPGEMWNWHEGKVALEYLFWNGEVGAARRVNFERHYDLIERILPPGITAQPTPDRADAQRELLRIAARAYGVATEPDLGDYFRIPRAESKRGVADLVDAGELLEVQVQDWKAPAYLWPAARKPRTISARALLSPFDPLIWFRDRALRLFGFHYRIEIYTPAEQRKHGYYVLPFLLGDTLVARVDLKADRLLGVLRVQSAWAEPDFDVDVVAVELAAELHSMAAWLGLADVVVSDRGDLAAVLADAVGRDRRPGNVGGVLS